jgi:hypothetical protein
MREYEMTKYLYETYGGQKTNMLLNSIYYCYTVYDTIHGKYYSGSRGVEGTNAHDLLSRYFSSSTVVDFVDRMKTNPELFKIYVEYFSTRADAFDAEKAYHEKFNVGKNPLFYNVINAGGTNCGAGSTLCRSDDGTIYRVSVEEYSTGNHKHISSGMMNIRTESGEIKKIKVVDYDPMLHTTEFKDYVMCIDSITGKSKRIPKDEFYSNERYIGITTGKVSAKNKKTGEISIVDASEFYKEDSEYVGVTHGEFKAIDRRTGEKRMISKDEYDSTIYKHPNEERIAVYSLLHRKNMQISSEEYYANSESYANLSTKCFYIVDDLFFKSKNLLDIYYRKTRNGKTVLKAKQHDMSKKFPDIKVITKEQHQNGDY